MAKVEMSFAACTACGLVRFESNGERLLRSATPGWTTPCRQCESWRANDDELWPTPSELPASATHRSLVQMLEGRASMLDKSTPEGSSLYSDLMEAAGVICELSAETNRRMPYQVPTGALVEAAPADEPCLCATAADIGAPDVYGGDRVIAHVNPYCPTHGAIANSAAAAATRGCLAASRCGKTVPGIDSVEPWPCSLLAGHDGVCE